MDLRSDTELLLDVESVPGPRRETRVAEDGRDADQVDRLRVVREQQGKGVVDTDVDVEDHASWIAVASQGEEARRQGSCTCEQSGAPQERSA